MAMNIISKEKKRLNGLACPVIRNSSVMTLKRRKKEARGDRVKSEYLKELILEVNTKKFFLTNPIIIHSHFFVFGEVCSSP
jgi:hypothetical protein